MKIGTLVVNGYKRLRRIPELSRDANTRLAWFDFYQACGDASLTCRHFGIARQTFYRWKRRYDPQNLLSLEARSHRPHQVRRRTASAELKTAVLRCREEYPRWGKDKIVVLLRPKLVTTASMVGRILGDLKESGILKEPPRNGISARKRGVRRPYAVRKPKDYVAYAPGDIVEVDTLDVRPLPGVILKHLTARDVISRWDVLGVSTTSSAAAAARFLDTLEDRAPFSIKGIQIDGGSEFQGIFETECQRRGIRLFVLPPRSPKLNGHVERAQRTHTEEFYEITDSSFELAELRAALKTWENVYNTVRPHQALGYLTPREYLECYWPHHRKEVMCH